MSKPLRVLMVEDSEADTLLTIGELKKGGYDPEYERVETAETMHTALREKTWDVILCDYRLPHFNGLAAIALLKETNIDIPLIIVSGTIGEETAVECMRLGAHDYVMKDNLPRLASAVERELKEAESRRQQKQAEEEKITLLNTVQEEKIKLSALIDSITDEVWFADNQKRFVIVNPSALKQFCIDPNQIIEVEMLAKSLVVLRPDGSVRPVEEAPPLRALLGEVVINQEEIVKIPASGEFRYRQVNASPVRDSAGNIIGSVSVVRDITERKQAQDALRQSEEYFKAIIENSSDIIFILDKLGSITYASPSIEHFLGYKPDELTGKSGFDLIVSDDKPRAIADFGRALLTKEVPIPNVFRIRHKNGTERILEGLGKNLFDNPIVKGFVMNVRDITERKQAEEDLHRANVFLDSIVENIPNMIFLKDAGNLRFVRFNRAGEDLLGYSINDLLGKNDYDFFPKEQADFFTKKDREVLHGKEIVDIPEELLQTRNKGERTMHTKKVPLLNVKGEPEYLLGISEDITERKRTEEQLQQTLESLRKAVGTTIQVMVSAVESRDPYTSGHQIRSADLARAIAMEMGLPQDKIDAIRMAGSIHDIGKLSIPAEILSKPTKLSEIEFSLIKEHARRGFEMLKDVESPWPLAEIVYQHHERIDGSGYPRSLKGEEILMEARILSVADVVEAMASHRPYRPGLGIEAALNEIEKGSGIFYDKAVADACLKLFREKGLKLATA